jgi:hypothetical protein
VLEVECSIYPIRVTKGEMPELVIPRDFYLSDQTVSFGATHILSLAVDRPGCVTLRG